MLRLLLLRAGRQYLAALFHKIIDEITANVRTEHH
jgi:hypothetical protein